MLNEGELRILSVVDSPKYLQPLANELDYRKDTVSRALNGLEKAELIHKEREGNAVVVEPSNARCVEVLRSLTKSHPHVDFPDLLIPSMVNVLFYLNSSTPWTAAELAERTGHSRSTVYRSLRTLTNRAMAVKKHGQYTLTEEFRELHEFAYDLLHHVHTVQVKRDTTSGTLVWESHDEYLVRTDELVDGDGYHRTGLDAFEEYGLEFFTTSEHYYFYSEDRDALEAEDLVCHLLLIGNDSRRRKYALLLMARADLSRDQLESTTRYYPVEDLVLQLHEFLETRGEQPSHDTPPWDEFETLATEYGVAV